MWLGIVVTLVWAILKTVGYIHSPPWQESLPFFALALTIIGGIYHFGRTMGDIQRTLWYIKLDIKTLKGDVKELQQDMKEVKTDIKELRHDFDAHMVRYHSG